MTVLGITGPIGSGKNMVARFFEEKGWVIVDVDLIGKQLLKEQETISHLKSVFGVGILGSDGVVNAGVLGGIVFSDPIALKKLNAIVHPEIKRRIEKFVCHAQQNIVIHAALLFQLHLAPLCNLILSIHASDELLIERILGRSPYLTRAMIENILMVQKRDNHFWNDADIIMNNSQTQQDLERKLERLYYQWKEG